MFLLYKYYFLPTSRNIIFLLIIILICLLAIGKPNEPSTSIFFSVYLACEIRIVFIQRRSDFLGHLFSALSLPPIVNYADSPQWHNAWYKDEVAAELKKMGYTNVSWWCAEDQRVKWMEHIPQQYTNDKEYLDRINTLCDRYNINDDTERLIRKRDDYWELIVRDFINYIFVSLCTEHVR
jgi:hypothetical protein